MNNKKNLILIFSLLFTFNQVLDMYGSNQSTYKLYIGWSSKNITPDKPVALAGQFETRISSEVKDSLICTALAIETRSDKESVETAIMVSCDLLHIEEVLYEKVIELIKKELPSFDSNKLVLNATHTHTGPALISGMYEIPNDVLQPDEYVVFVAEQIVCSAVEAWEKRQPAGMSWGLGQAVIGYNRRAIYFDSVTNDFGKGTAAMYGKTEDSNFSHIEGYEDHGLEMLFFWNDQKNLTGIVLNIACPAQETEGISQLSADFWHETRVELHKRYGEDIFIFPQIAAAGDISSHLLWRKEAEQKMLNRKGLTQRQEIGIRIANAVDQVFPYVQNEIKSEIVFSHLYEDLSLPVRKVTKEEAVQARKLAKKNSDREFWYMEIVDRYDKQDETPFHSTRVNVIRLDDVVIASNPFELFLDFGLRIKTQSNAILTFIVQLANGGGTYVPTAKAELGGGYSAIVQSNIVGSEGGQKLVDRTSEMINLVWSIK